MENRAKAARIMSRANILFFFCILLSILAGSFAVTAKGNVPRIVVSLCICGIFLIAGAVIVALHARVAARYTALAKQEEARVAEENFRQEAAGIEALSEDGLPGAFCREIRGYSAAQLRLILSEQEDEYSPEEFAFIKKVLAEEEADDEE